MEEALSRSEKKRRAKGIEQLARELVNLPSQEINALPCGPLLKEEMVRAKTLKGGAQKRQLKYIAKELRQTSAEPFFAFLEEKKGSKLKENRELHELEALRESILSEAIHAVRETHGSEEKLDHTTWESETVAGAAAARFPELDTAAVRRSALRYAVTRKPVHGREVFRLLKAAMERRKFTARKEKDDGV